MDQVVLRVVDAEGNTLPPGQTGEIVISNLINRATVLINYRMGDIGALSPEPCPCGRTLPTLIQMDGRTDDLVRLTNGEAVHESVLLSKLYSVEGVVQLQVVQESLTRFTIRLVCRPSGDINRVKRDLKNTFLAVIGGGEETVVTIEPVKIIPAEKSGKIKSVISQCL
jgi:phenylacetate-CoA ligase